VLGKATPDLALNFVRGRKSAFEVVPHKQGDHGGRYQRSSCVGLSRATAALE